MRFRYYSNAGWSSLVARRAHNPEVVGSNPTPATNFLFRLKGFQALAGSPSFLRKANVTVFVICDGGWVYFASTTEGQ